MSNTNCIDVCSKNNPTEENTFLIKIHNYKQDPNSSDKYNGSWYKIFVNDKNTNECLGRLRISSDETENHLEMMPILDTLTGNMKSYIDSIWKIDKPKEDESLYELISYSKRNVIVPHSYSGSLRRVYCPVSYNDNSSRNLQSPSISQGYLTNTEEENMILYKLSDFSSESTENYPTKYQDSIKIVLENNELELKLDTLTNKIVFSENSENISSLKDISFTFEIDRNPFINDSTLDKVNTIPPNVCNGTTNISSNDNSTEVTVNKSPDPNSDHVIRRRKALRRLWISTGLVIFTIGSFIGVMIFAFIKGR